MNSEFFDNLKKASITIFRIFNYILAGFLLCISLFFLINKDTLISEISSQPDHFVYDSSSSVLISRLIIMYSSIFIIYTQFRINKLAKQINNIKTSNLVKFFNYILGGSSFLEIIFFWIKPEFEVELLKNNNNLVSYLWSGIISFILISMMMIYNQLKIKRLENQVKKIKRN
jgi:hypothetical protein